MKVVDSNTAIAINIYTKCSITSTNAILKILDIPRETRRSLLDTKIYSCLDKASAKTFRSKAFMAAAYDTSRTIDNAVSLFVKQVKLFFSS